MSPLAIFVQSAPPGVSDLLPYAGPFGLATLLASWWISDLRARIKEANDENRRLNEKLVEMAEKSIPAMTESAKVLAEVKQELERARWGRERE